MQENFYLDTIDNWQQINSNPRRNDILYFPIVFSFLTSTLSLLIAKIIFAKSLHSRILAWNTFAKPGDFQFRRTRFRISRVSPTRGNFSKSQFNHDGFGMDIERAETIGSRLESSRIVVGNNFGESDHWPPPLSSFVREDPRGSFAKRYVTTTLRA